MTEGTWAVLALVNGRIEEVLETEDESEAALTAWTMRVEDPDTAATLVRVLA